MKNKTSATLIILTMFLLTQFIGLFVINAYTPSPTIDPATGENLENKNPLPFGLETPQGEQAPNLISLAFSFILALVLIFTLMKYRWKKVIRLWFLLVTSLALGLSINAFLKYTSLINISIIAMAIAIPLSLLKILKPNAYVHNATELLIYPGIAAVFVPILTTTSVIILLIAISIYDALAVWKFGFMQKMAKFQMEEIKIFGGFLIPSTSKKIKNQIKNIKEKYKNKKMPKSVKKKKFKIKMAILGGGDIIFPIITAGIFMRTHSTTPALFIIAGATTGLISIFLFSEKEKAYPAMPYITAGIFLGLIIWKIFFY